VIVAQLQPKNPGFQISLINDATIVGLGAGSLIASKIVGYGRLKTALLANFIIIIGCFPQMILSVWLFFLGRLTVGFGAGLLLVTTSVYVQETLPASKIEKCLTSLNLGITIGILLITLVQSVSLVNQDFATTKNWRVPFCAPMVAATINALLWLITLKYESLGELIK